MSRSEPLIPCRVIVGILGCLGCTLLYVLRSAISVAIVAMVLKKDIHNDYESKDVCFDVNLMNSTDYDPGYKGKYDWSESMQGIILGAYFYGYTLTQVLGGRLTEKFGAKWICGLGVFVPAVFNAFIPVSADLHVSLVITVRIIMGAFHGWVYSSLFSLFSKWFPKNELTLVIACMNASGNIGGIITMPITGYLCKWDFLDGWPTVYYFTSLIHIIWFGLWIYFVQSSPEIDPRITEKELKHVNQDKEYDLEQLKKVSFPWKSIVTSKPVYASIVAKFTGNFGYYILCTKMPKYLDSVFGVPIADNSWYNSLMYIAVVLSLVSMGPLSILIKNQGWISQTRNRKNFQITANFGAAICMIVITFVGCDQTSVIALLLLGSFFCGFTSGGEYATIPEYALNFSGTVFGLTNTFGSMTAFIGPLIVGILLDSGDGGRHQWNIVWYTSAVFNIFGAVFFEIFGSAEPQHWAVVSEKDVLKDKNIDNKGKTISVVSEHYKT